MTQQQTMINNTSTTPNRHSTSHISHNDQHRAIIPIDNLPLKYCLPIRYNEMASNGLARFQHDELLMSLPVVDENMSPIGLITRHKVLSEFGRKFSHELNRLKKVDILIENHFTLLDANTPLEKISHAMTNRDEYYSFDPAVITLDGQYIGMVSVIDILKEITNMRIEQAFDSNPLTYLPGNNRINAEIECRLHSGSAFLLAYIDLDHFKAFNDHYGFERGDRVIQLLAKILRECSEKNDFIGHIGGDDFVMLLTNNNWKNRLERILNNFARESPMLYDANDRQRGYLLGENRQGNSMRFNLMSLSIAVVQCDQNLFHSHIEIAEVAGEMKHKAKMTEGNSLVINQRQY